MSTNNITSYSIDMVYNENNEGLKLKPHFHNSYQIIYVLDGKIQCCINNKQYTVTRNSIIFINNMESHNIKVIEYPYRRYFTLIKPDFFKSAIQNPIFSSVFSNRSEGFRHVLQLDNDDENTIKYVSRNLRSLYEEVNNKDEFWEDVVKSHLNLIFTLLYRKHPDFFPLNTIGQTMHSIIKIQKYIEDHYTESITLDYMSKLFFINKYYISHQFKKVTGFTFKEYLIMQRISKAKDLLLYTNDNITHVCMNSGFNNVNHFIRIFKKYEGTTPYQYRKKNSK
ncbi:MAG TPA: AraC family transcriptional regulator [Thermoclostridium sp.]|nr:AraC family transcriptional regulator [Thermoclostridium sp.]